MNISTFKKGDIITRVEPMVLPNGNADRSYMGNKLEYIGTENGIIAVVEIARKQSVMLSANGYSNGWDYFPTKLEEKTKKRVNELKKERLLRL